MDGIYYKEWSRYLGREMEFKVYGKGGQPILALPCRGGRFYDWENNGMPDAIRPLLDAGKVQLFCADSVDAESLLNGGISPRRRAELEEAYFNYLTVELAERIQALNAPAVKAGETAPAALPILAVGADWGAYQAVLCRLRRPEVFGSAIGLSGQYDTNGWFAAGDDLALRCSPLAFLPCEGFFSAEAAAALAEDKTALILCAGQGNGEGEAVASTGALDSALKAAGFAVHTEIWGGDVNHDWYWWGRMFGMFTERML